MLPLVSPRIVQVLGGTVPRIAVPDTLVPFMNHTDKVPLKVSYQSRSPLPSPLRSAAPASVNEVGTLLITAACETEVPFISHIEIVPLVSRHSRSALPSPLKSCWPTIDKLLGTVPRPADCKTELLFISHSATLLLALRQSTSLLPSALKSWVLFWLKLAT